MLKDECERIQQRLSGAFDMLDMPDQAVTDFIVKTVRMAYYFAATDTINAILRDPSSAGAIALELALDEYWDVERMVTGPPKMNPEPVKEPRPC